MRGPILMKLSLLLCAALLAFGLVACGGDGDDGGGSTVEPSGGAVEAGGGGESSGGETGGENGATEAGGGAGSSSQGSAAEGEESSKDPAEPVPAPPTDVEPIDVEQAEQACERSEENLDRLEAEARANLERICDAVEAGDEEAMREAIRDVCRGLVLSSTEPGSTQRSTGLESCDRSAGL